jgi:hypothetical protein
MYICVSSKHLTALTLLCVTVTFAAGTQSNSPTFYKDILPILQQHCQTCHRPGEPGPMSLLNYAGTKPWARAIRGAVLSRQMPPWYADPEIGRFANDRSLSAGEIQTIAAWVDAGTEPGDPNYAPKRVRWIDGWTIGEPEIIFEMPLAFNVPISGVVPYQYVIVPTHFKEDTWVRLAEVRAGDRATLITSLSAFANLVPVGLPANPWGSCLR